MHRTRFIAPLLLALLVAGCTGATPAPTAAPEPDPASQVAASTPLGPEPPPATPTTEPTATAEPTATPEPTPTEVPLTVWLDPGLEPPVREAFAAAAAAAGGSSVGSPEEGTVQISLGAGEALGVWLYAVVAPFPTLADDVTASALASFWQGDGAELQGLWDGGALPTLYVTGETRAALVSLWGEPSPEAPVSVLGAEEILDRAWEERPNAWAIVPFERLEPRWKVLRVDGMSVLDKALDVGSYPLAARIGVLGDRADRLLAHLTQGDDQGTALLTNRDTDRMTVLVMTGVTALVRATAAVMEENGILFPAQDIGETLAAADITHISNEVPFAQNCPYPSRSQESLVFCSDPRYIELLRTVGTDIVELTGNHFQDYGDEATLFTLGMYDEEGWPYYGGGANLEDATTPRILEHAGNSFSFIGCNPVGPAFAWATEGRPGAAPCDWDAMHARLRALSEEVDVPIATFQYWEFYFYEPTPQQREDFRGMADAGARIVSGSQAHHPQAIEFYNGAFIHYGLGNLFFDQMRALGTRQQFVDRHLIYDGRHVSTELLTYMLEDWSRPRPMTLDERRTLLTSVFQASGW